MNEISSIVLLVFMWACFGFYYAVDILPEEKERFKSNVIAYFYLSLMGPLVWFVLLDDLLKDHRDAK